MSVTSQFAPKVHPLTRNVEPEDPLELMADAAPGNPATMLQCIVQEFAGLGASGDEILTMFRSSGYPALNQLLELFGDDEVRRRLDGLLSESGVFRVHASIAEPEPDEEELIQLGIRAD